ncbi:EAL domain-containing protein [Lutimaribacter marinistellae]|uniref:EAL domain-containing protein n=1 Tax=Lutimaribacter marinistellae TaxID=1820329 RepID=A0ABV7TD14_9RHOB
MNRKKRAEIPAGAENPLNAAVAGRDRSTLAMVTEAIKHKQCMLAFQPVMQAQPPHGVAFYEALIRVMDETGRVIPARDFMPVVEDTELGRDLDAVALEIGLRTLVRNPDIRLSVNMSARSIGYQRWMRTLGRFLDKDPTLGERLILEITEGSAMMLPELVIDFMDRLQPKGICFALDDYGSSTFSFRHFRDFLFDATKIDGQFVRGVAGNRDNQALTRALVSVAREFDMLITAESVETVEDAEFLVSIGVDCLQGYLFGAPTVSPPWKDQGKERARA